MINIEPGSWWRHLRTEKVYKVVTVDDTEGLVLCVHGEEVRARPLSRWGGEFERLEEADDLK